MPFLTLPSSAYKASFCQAAQDRMEQSQNPDWLRFQIEHFEEYLSYLDKLTKGEGAKGSVPQTTYWLIEGETYLGEIQIRHVASGKIPSHIYYDIAPKERGKGYGILILKLGLEKARELGLKEVILTCNQENIASQKVIEANNGVLLEMVSDSDQVTRVYKIALP